MKSKMEKKYFLILLVLINTQADSSIPDFDIRSFDNFFQTQFEQLHEA